MDNITHSFIGLGVGELVHRSLPPEPQAPAQRTRRALFLFTAWFASNAPDLDLVLTRLLPRPFGYMLHHRGHTHTLLLALPQALLLLALLWLLWPGARRLLKSSVPARVGLAACLLLGFCLHMGMDFLNSYGLHPFYPFDSRWLYGDMVFIVEPMFWVLLGVPVIMSLRYGIVKSVLLAALAAALCFFTYKTYLAPASLAVLLGLGVMLAVLQGRAGERGRGALLLAFALAATFIGTQGVASALGRTRIEAAVQRLDPGTRVWDVAMTAFPSKPPVLDLCLARQQDRCVHLAARHVEPVARIAGARRVPGRAGRNRQAGPATGARHRRVGPGGGQPGDLARLAGRQLLCRRLVPLCPHAQLECGQADGRALQPRHAAQFYDRGAAAVPWPALSRLRAGLGPPPCRHAGATRAGA